MRRTQKEFAEIAAKASQKDVAVAAAPSSRIRAINYWVDNDGLGEKQLMAQVDELVRVGIMKAENKPSYDKTRRHVALRRSDETRRENGRHEEVVLQ